MAATGKILATNCRQDPACTSDPVADLAWLVRHGELDGSPLNGTSLMESLSILSLNSVNPTLKGIPLVLNKARNGDTAGLKELFQQASTGGMSFDQLSAGLHLVTLCSDLQFPWGASATPPAARSAPLAKAVSALDPTRLHPYDVRTARNQLMIEGCRLWPAMRAAAYPASQELLPRTLLLHGGNDLFCPPEWAAWEKAHARQAELVVVPGSGHGVQSNRQDPTGRDKVKAFLLG